MLALGPRALTRLRGVRVLFQLCFELFDRWQAALKTLGQGLGQSVFRNADRLSEVAESVLSDHLILRLAKNDADTGFVVRVPQQIIDGGKVEIHLAAELRLELTGFQLHDDECAEAEVVEQEVEAKVLPVKAGTRIVSVSPTIHPEPAHRYPLTSYP